MNQNEKDNMADRFAKEALDYLDKQIFLEIENSLPKIDKKHDAVTNFLAAVDEVKCKWLHTDALSIQIDTTPDLAPPIVVKWEGHLLETNNLYKALITATGWLKNAKKKGQ